MNPFKALRLGLGRAKIRKRALVLYWLFHTAMALVVAVPIAGTGIEMVAKSKYGDELLRDFDLMFIFEAVYQANGAIWPIFVGGASLFVLFIGVMYLTGGALHVLRKQDEAYSPALFWEGAGLYFWRFLRVALYSLLAWIPLLIVRGGFQLGVKKLWGEGMEEAPVYMANQAKIVLSLLLAGYAVTVVDFTRVHLAATGSRKAFRTLLKTMVWVARNPWFAFGPWAILGLTFAVVTAAYLKLANWMPTPIVPMAVLMIILQQAYVLFRVFLRFVGWGTAIEIDSAVRGDNENHGPEQEVFSFVDNGGDGHLRASAAADPEAESPQAG